MSVSEMKPISIIPADEPRALAAVTPMDMLEKALTSGASMEVLEKFMALSERWEANQARKSFDAAMSAAKAEIPIINKNRTVDFTSAKGRTHYRHEDLAEVARTVSPILARHGLSYRYRATSAVNEPVTVTCIISHREGHFEETTLSGGRDESGNKNSIQAVGSTLTYLQRMTLKAALGLAASDDDDGASTEMPGLVSEKQLEQLVELADEVGADKAKFCAFLNVPSFAAIPVRDFDKAIAALQAKRGRK